MLLLLLALLIFACGCLKINTSRVEYYSEVPFFGCEQEIINRWSTFVSIVITIYLNRYKQYNTFAAVFILFFFSISFSHFIWFFGFDFYSNVWMSITLNTLTHWTHNNRWRRVSIKYKVDCWIHKKNWKIIFYVKTESKFLWLWLPFVGGFLYFDIELLCLLVYVDLEVPFSGWT